VGDLGLSQPTISQHLKELKNAGIIQGTVEGTSVCYCINPKVWKQYQRFFNELFIDIKEVAKGNCC
jgi:predicted transcriptional regulator